MQSFGSHENEAFDANGSYNSDDGTVLFDPFTLRDSTLATDYCRGLAKEPIP